MDDPKITFEQNLVLEQYRCLRAEIVTRIQEHHRLWFWKLISIGALLSFALSKTSMDVKYSFALVPFLAVVFDALIVNNLVLVGGLGSHISEVIEGGHGINGWDTLSLKNDYFGKKKRQWLNDWLIVNVTTLSTLVISIFLLFTVEQSFSLKLKVFMTLALLSVLSHTFISWKKLCSIRNITGNHTNRKPPNKANSADAKSRAAD